MTKINATQILPIAMILLDAGAAAVCLWHWDYRRAVYWIAAAVLNATISDILTHAKRKPNARERKTSINRA